MQDIKPKSANELTKALYIF